MRIQGLVYHTAILCFILGCGGSSTGTSTVRPRARQEKTTSGQSSSHKQEIFAHSGGDSHIANSKIDQTFVVACGAISRSELLDVLNSGIAFFLQNIEVEPRVKNGLFIGWRLTRFYTDEQRFTNNIVKLGDVILSINGKSIERPENFHRVWQDMANAKFITISLLRGKEKQKIVCEIVD